MKLNKTMLVTLLAGMALCGCQKDDDASSNENGGTGVKGTPLIATMTLHNEDGVTARSFRYDEKGRLVGEVDKRNSVDYYFSTIAYEVSKYVRTSVFVESGDKMVSTGILNEKGLETSVTQICTPHDSDSGLEVCEYNSEGYRIHRLLTYKNGHKHENTYSYTGDNLVEDKDSFQDDSYSYKWTYYADRVNTIGIENLGVSFMGKQSKNLIKSQTIKATGKDVTYTYEFDSKNRVTKQLCSDGSYTEYTYVK